MLGRALREAHETVPFRLVSLDGGKSRNAITRDASAVVSVAAAGESDFRAAVEKDRVAGQARVERQSIEERLATLTQREREVLEYVVAGQINKRIAAELGIVEKTIKVHRSRVMAKMGVESLADLVRLAERAGIVPIGPKSNIATTRDV